MIDLNYAPAPPMDPSEIYAKTELGLAELRDRKLNLPITLRGLLILIDGNRTVAQVLVKARALKLDERGLGAVAAGTAAGAAGLLGPVNVAVGVSNPTEVVVSPRTEVAAGVGVAVANQVGTGVAVNATTALGVLADGVAAAGFSEVGANLGLP